MKALETDELATSTIQMHKLAVKNETIKEDIL